MGKPPPHRVAEAARLTRAATHPGRHWHGTQVKFEIPYFTVSGVQVRYLKVVEKSGYQALPWVRYITVSGNYEIRMS